MDEKNISKSYRNLEPHSNFSFETIEHDQWMHVNLNNSLFNGSVFFDCEFVDISFDNSDLEGTRFNGCLFRNCSFVGADMHSIWISKCKFYNVIFDEIILFDSTFQDCIFENCSFNSTSQLECIFTDCIFDPFAPKGSSITLNQYKNTTFHRAVFNNVFYYQWFDNCCMPNASLEAYLLGYCYGLTSKNLEECNIIVMGDKIKRQMYSNRYNISDIYQIVKEIYIDRHMYLNIGILELNDNHNSKDEILLKCVYLLKLLLSDNQLLKNEQIKFLERLIMSLYGMGEVAPITIYLLEREMQKIINDYQDEIDNNTVWAKAQKDIVTLKNSLYFVFLKFLDKLQETLQNLPVIDDLVLEFTYEEKPQIPFTEIAVAMMPTFPMPTQIKVEKGSYIEIIQFCKAALPYIKVFLELLGIVVPIALTIRNERREDRKEKEEKEKKIKESEQLKELGVLPSVYITPGVTITNGAQVSQVTKVIIEFKLLYDSQKKGYNAKNLKTIKLVSNVKGTQDI